MEDSLVLTAASLVRKRALVAGAWTSGSWGWTSDGEDKPHATIGYEANLLDQDNAWLRLHYRRNGEPVDYRVRLVTSTPHYGGLRWWFIYPLVRNDGGPPRRVAKLYLPSGGKYFGSREGYGLTYATCQESGKNGRLWRALGAEIGIDEKTMRGLMKDRWASLSSSSWTVSSQPRGGCAGLSPWRPCSSTRNTPP